MICLFPNAFGAPVLNRNIYALFLYISGAGRLPYKSNGYVSEPEPNYDSDYSMKCGSYDARSPLTTINQYSDR